MATTLRPFRDYDEHDVINLFSLSGDVTNGVTKGHMVKLQAGWSNTAELDRLGAVGSSYANTVSERYGVAAKVAVAGSGDSVL